MVGRFPSRRSAAALFSLLLSLSLVMALAPVSAPEGDVRPAGAGPSHGFLDSKGNYSIAVGDGHMHSTYSSGVTTVHQ
ncbi:MAG: hypothetical protein LN417_09640, partial [Candidatus Thermoplasmatota archaeon]|nr:hypothetical protein [Candidatus Thermoplasmatota archaeon]